MTISPSLPEDGVEKIGWGHYNNKKFTMSNAHNYLSSYPNVSKIDMESNNI